jgi:acylphosphatase
VNGRLLRIHGRVQGVFYRAWAIGEAQALGVKGWVRNRRDGSVEVAAWGSDEALDSLLIRCRQGPPEARVERIDVIDADGAPPPDFTKAATL